MNRLTKMSWIEQRHAEEDARRKERSALISMSRSVRNGETDAPIAPPKLDPVVEANRALLHSRSQVGIAKYGVTLDGARLSERELIVHALQEALDLANYLQAQLQRVDREAGNGK